MLKPTLIALAIALAGSAATAATQTFDNFASGTVINTAIPGLSFRDPVSGGGVPIMVGSYGSGNNVLSLGGDIAFNASQGAIDVSFSTPQRSVSVRAAAHRETWYLGTALNRPYLEAWDTSGAYMGRVLYRGPLPSNGATMPFETLTIVSTSVNIGRVRMSSQASQPGSPIDGIFDTLAYSRSTEPTGTLYDDFSSLNRLRWTQTAGGTGITSLVASGQLHFELDPSASGATIYQRWSATCMLDGDFDLRVDYQHSGGQSGVRAALIADGAGHVERSSLSSSDIYTPGEYYITNISGYVPGFVQTKDTRGSLRLVRAGNLMTSYYGSSLGGWSPIYQQYVTTSDLPFGLQVWTHDWAYARQGAAVSFDNLMLASGRFLGKGCPN